MKSLREKAVAERRSLKNEIVFLLERAVEPLSPPGNETSPLSRVDQISRWAGLSGRWQDERTWEAIAVDILIHRTAGREVAL